MQSAYSIEVQIKVLSKKVALLPEKNKAWYALTGKIKQLEKKLSEIRYEEFLSK